MLPLNYQDGFSIPSDITGYTPVPVSYATGSNTPIIGDGTGTRGSPCYALQHQLPDIASVAPGWILPSTEAYPPPPLVTNLDADEAKFRAHINMSHILPDDPIRNYGRPGTSHLHEFFGNANTNAFSTFASLRNRANRRALARQSATTGSGGPYNATAYWVPAMLKGNRVVKAGAISLYYTANPARRSLKSQQLPRGLRYVTGFDMDDPLGLLRIAERDAANTAAGHNRYSLGGNGFDGWAMEDPTLSEVIPTSTGQTFNPSIVNPDGSNPWPDAYPGCWLKATINGPSAYDGHNLWSPGGYKHVYHGLQDNDTGQVIMPQGAIWIPALVLFIYYQHQGPEDYMQWTLSSDDHASMVATQQAGHSVIIPPGGSYHTDWIGAWDDKVFGQPGWQGQCVGTFDGAIMHTCGSGAFRGDGTRLLDGGDAPDGSRKPQVGTEALDTNNPDDLFPVPDSFAGPFTLNAAP